VICNQGLFPDILDAAFRAFIFGADVVVFVVLQEALDDVGIEDTCILDIGATIHHREAVAVVNGNIAGSRE
jgi:hypothetical protein